MTAFKITCFAVSTKRQLGIGREAAAVCCTRRATCSTIAHHRKRTRKRFCSWLVSELLSREVFDEKLTRNELSIAFVGMSNSGKSFRSRKLATELGFDIVSVDEEIEKLLQQELGDIQGAGTDALASWMGFPFHETFRERERRYLQIEEDITSNARPRKKTNFALDTTGSVVYLSTECQEKIRRDYLIVYLEIAESSIAEMIETFFKCPKPVVWGDKYVRLPEANSDEENLRMCYPELLRWRAERYKKLSDITVPSDLARSSQVSSEAFLDIMRSKLRAF